MLQQNKGPTMAQIEACRAAHGDVRDTMGRPIGRTHECLYSEYETSFFGNVSGKGLTVVRYHGAEGQLVAGTVLVKASTSEELVISASWDGTATLAVANTATSEWLPPNARPSPAIREMFDHHVERIWDALLGDAPDQLTLLAWEAKRAEKAAKKAAKAEAPAKVPASPWAALAALKAA